MPRAREVTTGSSTEIAAESYQARQHTCQAREPPASVHPERVVPVMANRLTGVHAAPPPPPPNRHGQAHSQLEEYCQCCVVDRSYRLCRHNFGQRSFLLTCRNIPPLSLSQTHNKQYGACSWHLRQPRKLPKLLLLLLLSLAILPPSKHESCPKV